MRIGADTVAVVTGAAGGIGRGLALELARRGAPLALVDVDAARLGETRALAAAHGVRVSTHVTDVADRAAMAACVYPGPVATDLVRRGRAWDAAKQAAEAEFVASRAIPVARVARRIVRGIERGRARVLIGAETRAIDAATRLAPGLVNTLVGRLRGRVPFL